MLLNHSTLALQIPKEAQEQLQELQNQLQDHFNQCHALKRPTFLPTHLAEKIQESLSEILAADDTWRQFFEQLHAKGEHQLLQLQGDNNVWLNQFWRMAKCPVTGKMLGDIPNLFLSNQIPPYTSPNPFVADNPLPLKILVMISSPENSPIERLLDYEGEERALLEAFEPLFEQGQVQIDFTDVGSLEALKAKLKVNRYHILHFSGHGNYHEGVGYLELEDHGTMDSKRVKAADFAAALNAKPEHRPALVLLSSCLTAKGSAEEEGLSGVTNAVLREGIPAVVAMSGSIADQAAIEFAAELYGQIAQEEPLHRAFKAALQVIRQSEAEKWAKVGGSAMMRPLQWLYPQVYQQQIVADLVDWTGDSEEVKLGSYRFVSGAEQMILKRSLSKQHYFVGRRKDKRQALPHFLAGKALLLKGQGGMGKTTMAEYLVQRMIAHDNRTHPFLFDQKANLETVLESLSDALEDVYEDFDFQEKLENIKKGSTRFKFLLKTLKSYCKPLFVFDNLETFQSEPGKEFKAAHSDIADIIEYLYNTGKVPLLLTCRYEVAECPDIYTVNLNHVGLNDFWKKVRYLSINRLAKHLQSQRQNITPNSRLELTYKAVVTWLHQTFGGNFRALEYFDEQFQQQPENILQSIQNLNELQSTLKDATEETLRRMTTNLAFGQLLQVLKSTEQQSLQLLAHFQTPVQVQALQLQNPRIAYTAALPQLQSLTLVEHAEGFYYVNPLTQELLLQQNSDTARPPAPFSNRKAGNYYYARYHNTESPTIGEVEAGLQHYLEAKYAERVNELGGIVLNYYYGLSAFRKALAYAVPIERIAAENMDTNVRNLIGLIYNIFGEYGRALKLYEYNLVFQQQRADKSGEGTTLNNLATTAHAKGDYDTALKYLKLSLNIQQQIGDKSGEGTTLNNISQIFKARGDYDTALKYLKLSLDIRQQIGDKSGEGATLNNIAGIYRARGDYDTALKYLKLSLDIAQQIGDKSGEGKTFNNISQIYDAKGDYDTALKYLKQSLDIQQQIGDKSGEGTTLNNISQIFKARGDYDTALKYLKQSLDIQQQIGDKSGEGTTLNNISQIFMAKGDYDTALNYLKLSLDIKQQIGDRQGMSVTLGNIAQIYKAWGDYEKAMEYMNSDLEICQSIGDKSGEGTTLNNIAGIYRARGDYDTALKYLKLSLDIKQQIGDINGVAITLWNMVDNLFQKKQFEEAVLPLLEAYQIFRQIGSPNVKAVESWLGALIGEIGEERFREIMERK